VKLRLLSAVGAALALVLLSGCDQSPQTAAHVGSTTITTDDLDLMAQALCAEASSGQSQGQGAQPVSRVNSAALGALISSAVDAQYAAEHDLGYDRATMAQQLQQLDPLIAKLPEADQKRTKELITQLFKGQMQIFDEAVSKLRASGVQPTQELVQQAAQATETEYAKKLDIDVNPRYSAPGPGHEGDGSQSLSRAVSGNAKTAASENPDPGWVTGLPATQRCG
jgi:hypothetical protein